MIGEHSPFKNAEKRGGGNHSYHQEKGRKKERRIQFLVHPPNAEGAGVQHLFTPRLFFVNCRAVASNFFFGETFLSLSLSL